jgi:dihydroxyacetone kinase-like protein
MKELRNMEKIDKVFLKSILNEVVTVMDLEREYLTELDAAMGDGDLGLTMTSGFRSIRDEMDLIDSEDMGIILMKLGMKMNSTVASTMGTLISICFLKSAQEVKGKTKIDIKDVVQMGKAAVRGVMERGKAKLGERTMLDALYPAVEALSNAMHAGKTLQEAYDAAYKAAESGVEATKELIAVHGRAAYYKEKTLGRPDPGAVSILFILKGISQSFKLTST